MDAGVHFVGAGEPLNPQGEYAEKVARQLAQHDRHCQYPPCADKRERTENHG